MHGNHNLPMNKHSTADVRSAAGTWRASSLSSGWWLWRRKRCITFDTANDVPTASRSRRSGNPHQRPQQGGAPTRAILCQKRLQHVLMLEHPRPHLLLDKAGALEDIFGRPERNPNRGHCRQLALKRLAADLAAARNGCDRTSNRPSVPGAMMNVTATTRSTYCGTGAGAGCP